MRRTLISLALLALFIALPPFLHANTPDSYILVIDDLLTETHVVPITNEGRCVPVNAFSQAVGARYDSDSKSLFASNPEVSISVDPTAGIGTLRNNEVYAPIGYLCMKMNLDVKVDNNLGIARVRRSDEAMSHEAFSDTYSGTLRAGKLFSALENRDVHWGVMAFDDRCWQNTFTLRSDGRIFVLLSEVVKKLTGQMTEGPLPITVTGTLGSMKIEQDPKALQYRQFTISTKQPILFIEGIPYLEASSLKSLFNITWDEDPATGTMRFLTGVQVPSFASFLKSNAVLPTALSKARKKEAYLFRTAYLTFDDGPSRKVTPEILRILKEHNIKATFFVLGKSVKQNPEMLKRIADEGHVIGNHTYSHVYEVLYSKVDNFMREIEQTNALLRGILGHDTLMVRAPYGSAGTFKPIYYTRLQEKEMKTYIWNVDSEDSKSTKVKAEQIIAAVRKQVAPKSEAIILMHDADSKKETVRALPEIIKMLRETGFDINPLRYETIIHTKGIVR